jgi:hypothetical protein
VCLLRVPGQQADQQQGQEVQACRDAEDQALTAGTVDDRFDFTIGLMIDGLPGSRRAQAG